MIDISLVERRRLEAEFAETREDLIAVKTKLNDLPLAEWRDFTNSRHKGLFVIRDIKKRMNPEMCTQVSEVEGVMPDTKRKWVHQQ